MVLVAGKKDHGPGEHDYPAWQKAWAELFKLADKVDVVTAWEWPERDEFQKADVMVFFQHGDWDAQRAADIDAFLERGGGLVYIHWAVDGRDNAAGFAKRIGLASVGGKIKFRHGPLDLEFTKEAKHPIARNFDRLKLVDESYWMLTGDLPAGPGAGDAGRGEGSRGRCSGRPSRPRAACSCRSPATTRGRSTTRCSACCCCAASRGPRRSRWTGSTTWCGRVRTTRNDLGERSGVSRPMMSQSHHRAAYAAPLAFVDLLLLLHRLLHQLLHRLVERLIARRADPFLADHALGVDQVERRERVHAELLGD